MQTAIIDAPVPLGLRHIGLPASPQRVLRAARAAIAGAMGPKD